jgi:hypothetical protein
LPRLEWRLDVGTAITIVLLLVTIGTLWGSNSAINDGQTKQIERLITSQEKLAEAVSRLEVTVARQSHADKR